MLHCSIILSCLPSPRAREAEALRGLADIYEARNEPELALRCLTRIREILTRFRPRGTAPPEDSSEREIITCAHEAGGGPSKN